MTIVFNGEPRDVAVGKSVADLLRDLQFDVRRVAVEVNQTLVPRQRHAECLLQAGDEVEVVTLVGGG